jgi:hypothetical protein
MVRSWQLQQTSGESVMGNGVLISVLFDQLHHKKSGWRAMLPAGLNQFHLRVAF